MISQYDSCTLVYLHKLLSILALLMDMGVPLLVQSSAEYSPQ